MAKQLLHPRPLEHHASLTLDYGVRWEYFPVPTRSDRGLESYDPVSNKVSICGVGQVPNDCGTKMSKRLFAPRLGIAYRATNNTVLRAGYGITIDPFLGTERGGPITRC